MILDTSQQGASASSSWGALLGDSSSKKDERWRSDESPDENKKIEKMAERKRQLREDMWTLLEKTRDTGSSCALEAFPPSCFDKIPHFTGCKDAAWWFTQLPEFHRARIIKINPSLAQQELRFYCLLRGKKIISAEPMTEEVMREHEKKTRISHETKTQRQGNSDDTPFTFYLLDPERIPKSKWRRASSKAGAREFGIKIDLFCCKNNTSRALSGVVPSEKEDKINSSSWDTLCGKDRMIDLLITGVTVVSLNGVRLGKGKGYAEREWEIFARRGLVDVHKTLVCTTCHELQVKPYLNVGHHMDPGHDLGIDIIVTPSYWWRVKKRIEKPAYPLARCVTLRTHTPGPPAVRGNSSSTRE